MPRAGPQRDTGERIAERARRPRLFFAFWRAVCLFYSLHEYGVRPRSAYTLRDQLGLVPGTKSKIEDGSDTGTSGGEVVTVADFR